MLPLGRASEPRTRAQAATPEPQAKTPGMQQAVHTQNSSESRRCKRVLLTSDGGGPGAKKPPLSFDCLSRQRSEPFQPVAASTNRDGCDVVAKGFPTTGTGVPPGQNGAVAWIGFGPAYCHIQSRQYTNGIAHRWKVRSGTDQTQHHAEKS